MGRLFHPSGGPSSRGLLRAGEKPLVGVAGDERRRALPAAPREPRLGGPAPLGRAQRAEARGLSHRPGPESRGPGPVASAGPRAPRAGACFLTSADGPFRPGPESRGPGPVSSDARVGHVAVPEGARSVGSFRRMQQGDGLRSVQGPSFAPRETPRASGALAPSGQVGHVHWMQRHPVMLHPLQWWADPVLWQLPLLAWDATGRHRGVRASRPGPRQPRCVHRTQRHPSMLHPLQ